MERILGLDVGDKTVGVAVSDTLGLIAHGVTTIFRSSNKQTFAEIEKLIAEYEISKIVVGLPMNMNHSEGERAELTRKFATKLQNKFRVEIFFEDERLTTKSALLILDEAEVQEDQRKAVVDKIAATFILQSFLDRRREEFK